MREWKRILLSPVWLGVLALLVVCHAGLYLRTQSDLAGGSLSVYSRESNRWGGYSVRIAPGYGHAAAGSGGGLHGQLAGGLGLRLRGLYG